MSLSAAQTPTNVTVLPNTITAGSSTTGMVALSTASTKAQTLKVSSSVSGVTVPATVAVATGQQYVSFSISSSATLSTSTAAITASLNSGSAVGFLLVNAQPVTYPAYNPLVLTPLIDVNSPQITATLSFTKPLLVAMKFNLTSSNPNFTVPATLSVNAGATSAPFTVTASPKATTDVVTVTTALVPGSYQNLFTGPLSVASSFTYVSGVALPPNYQVGFWQSQGVKGALRDDVIALSVKTYATGRVAFGAYWFDSLSNSYEDITYDGCGHLTPTGQLDLDIIGDFIVAFPALANGGGLYDSSTMTFSKDGKTMTLVLIRQSYTWKIAANPTIVMGPYKTMGTYTFTRVL